MTLLVFTLRGTSRLAVCVAVLLGAVLPASAVSAAPVGLTVTPLTWDVVGLDSNNVAVGPNLFPVGERVCNTSATTLASVTATLVWDTANATITTFGPASMDLGDLAASACSDAYFNVQITRTAAAYNTTRAFHVTASSGATSAQSPANRQLYVEKLVSQNRNSVDSITSTAIDTSGTSTAAGTSTVYLGHTYVFHVNSHTATGGYEQLESEVTFPTPIFRVLKVAASYAVPSGATNDRMYADACGWDPVTTSATYRSCVGPVGFTGGKAGGNPIGTDYTVQVVGTGTGSVSTLIYDFSGSSYHYNSDFGLNTTSVAFTAAVSPTAVDDGASTKAGQSVSVPVLANDTGGVAPLAVTTHSAPSHGSVSCTASACTYTPSSGYAGADTFTYTIADAHGTTSTATVSVTVQPAPVAADDSAGTGAGQPVTVDVMDNDNAGVAPTTVTSHTAPAHGDVTCTSTACTYTPSDGYTGTDTFDYTITDSTGSTSAATVTLTVYPLPTATDDSATTTAGQTVDVHVLTNDSLGVAPTSVTSQGSAANGDVSCTAAVCTYSPDPIFTGSDSFTYTITDSRGATSTATVDVTVDPAPTTPSAVDDERSTTVDTPVTFDVLANDAIGTGPTTVTSTSTPAHGDVTCSGGECTYTPATGYTGSDTFDYTETDSNGATASATVTVTIDPVPVAVDDDAATTADTPVDVFVLTNDVLGVPLTAVTSHTTPANGIVTCTSTVCTYTPVAVYVGSDSFDYTITDGNGRTSTATVSVTVDAAPVPPTPDPTPTATDDSISTDAGSPVVIDVLDNDTAGAGATSITGHTSPGHGTVDCTEATCTYTPDAGYDGPDSFTYTVTDANGATATATVSLTVTAVPSQPDPPVQDPPVDLPPVVLPPVAGPVDPGDPRTPSPARTGRQDPVVVPDVHAVQAARLPFTGAPVSALLTDALAAMVVGVLLLGRGRRARQR